MDDPLFSYHLVTAVTLLTYKVVTLVIGYLFAKLGYRLFLKGVKGEFKFKYEFKGAGTADLASASPGIFFAFVGVIIIVVALSRGLELKVETDPTNSPSDSIPLAQPKTNRFEEDKVPRLRSLEDVEDE